METYFKEIVIKIQRFSLKKLYLKMSSAAYDSHFTSASMC